MLLALSGTNKPGGNSLPFSDLNFAANNLSTHHLTPGSRKRFRTKFSQAQKEKMHEFADRIGWKFQKRDEDDVRDFCSIVRVLFDGSNKYIYYGAGGYLLKLAADNTVAGLYYAPDLAQVDDSLTSWINAEDIFGGARRLDANRLRYRGAGEERRQGRRHRLS